MAWPPTTATKREAIMSENGMIRWLKKACLVRADIFIRIGKQRQRMVASKRGLLRDLSAQPALLNPPLNGEVSLLELKAQP
ncbi:hypothetical protein CN204_30265 [Sinorhizobium meliloti]|nr:hypothetical protein SMRU11_07625 [Sinorhizobium meliloti RU11/001]MDE3763774.1 hypothetical protein [Sinorhizobium meliloti]PST22623.1 hypothetical protein C7U62_21265 [Mesorhizobium loti]MDE3776132.1 hypothetical protein [Sinorhizobium meliloti]MDE3787874.1 hypothetical protein [Sinorhizobium meliloti]